MPRIEALGEIISRKRIRKAKGRETSLESIKFEWKNIAGERLFEHSKPTSLTKGTLGISAEGSSWATEG